MRLDQGDLRHLSDADTVRLAAELVRRSGDESPAVADLLRELAVAVLAAASERGAALQRLDWPAP